MTCRLSGVCAVAVLVATMLAGCDDRRDDRPGRDTTTPSGGEVLRERIEEARTRPADANQPGEDAR